MSLKQTITVFELLDSAKVNGQSIQTLFAPYASLGVEVTVTTVHNEAPEDSTKGPFAKPSRKAGAADRDGLQGANRSNNRSYCEDLQRRRPPEPADACGAMGFAEGPKTTDFIQILIPGTRGKTAGGAARTLGLVGRNGAIGARPAKIGMVSDADGPIGVLAAALKLADMKANGDDLPGDVLITTHLSTDVAAGENDGIPFMGMPVSSDTMNRYEVSQDMDAILSLDASKGNSIIKQRGFAITPTAMQGYILRVAPHLVKIMESTTGRPAVTLPISLQDITPYANGLYHFNSIMQPHTATQAPVVGVAITARSVVGGSDSSASHEVDIAEAVRFCIEVAKRFSVASPSNPCEFYDTGEWGKIRAMYPDLSVFQTNGTERMQRAQG